MIWRRLLEIVGGLGAIGYEVGVVEFPLKGLRRGFASCYCLYADVAVAVAQGLRERWRIVRLPRFDLVVVGHGFCQSCRHAHLAMRNLLPSFVASVYLCWGLEGKTRQIKSVATLNVRSVALSW